MSSGLASGWGEDERQVGIALWLRFIAADAALRRLAALPLYNQRQTRKKIDQLANQPRPPGVKRWQGAREYWRIRVGNYRVIYTIQGDRLLILVIKIGHRRDVCRAL